MLRIVLILMIVGLVLGDDSFQWYRSEGSHREVMTEGGVLRGEATSKNYVAFLGVPYAGPPTGNNRFKAPLPPPKWSGVLDATRKVQCPQRGIGDEDCLILNIFTPNTILGGPLPVLLYIHSGSFLFGSGQTEGVEPLIKQNIIVVTINYRLGALGFLCLGIEEAPGNAGLKDQVAALQWINRNIINFGGDPNQVTIYGMSAGGASVEYQVLSRMGKGLFQNAIVESASVNSVWTVDRNPIVTARDVAAHLGFPQKNKDLHRLVEYFRQVPANRMSEVNLEYYNNLTDGTFGFVPCVERRLDNIEAFITDAPLNIIEKEQFDKVPIMFMFATLEGLFLRSEDYNVRNYPARMDGNFIDFLPADMHFDTLEIKQQVASNIKVFYFGNKTVNDVENLENYLNYFGDCLVMHGLLNNVEIHSKSGNPVYLMEFAYRGNLGTTTEDIFNSFNSAGHGDVIKHAVLIKPVTNDDDKLTVSRISKLISNFVKIGNPTPERTDLLPILWPAVTPGNVSYLQLGRDFQILEEPMRDRKAFWDQLYHKFRRNYDKSQASP